MKKLRQSLIPLSFLLILPALSTFYKLLNNADRGAISLVTQLDRAIPFMEIFSIPYMIWYPFVMGTLACLCLTDRRTYYRTLVSYVICLIVCYTVYYFYQTTVPRPELVGDGILTRFMTRVYSNDNPYNCFPSIHVLSSYLMMIAISKSAVRNTINTLVIYSVCSVIIISTLFVKQHVILDVVSGIFLADIVFRVVYVIEWDPLFSRVERFIASLFDYTRIKREVS